MAISRPSVICIALAVLTLWLPRHALAADRWAIPPGQEAVLEKALAPTAAWLKPISMALRSNILKVSGCT